MVVILKNCPEFIELYLACARLGAVFVPVNFRLTAPEAAHIVDNAQPRIAVFGGEYDELAYRLQAVREKHHILFSCVGGMRGTMPIWIICARRGAMTTRGLFPPALSESQTLRTRK